MLLIKELIEVYFFFASVSRAGYIFGFNILNGKFFALVAIINYFCLSKYNNIT